jgi:hypothetical protein
MLPAAAASRMACELYTGCTSKAYATGHDLKLSGNDRQSVFGQVLQQGNHKHSIAAAAAAAAAARVLHLRSSLLQAVTEDPNSCAHMQSPDCC